MYIEYAAARPPCIVDGPLVGSYLHRHVLGAPPRAPLASRRVPRSLQPLELVTRQAGGEGAHLLGWGYRVIGEGLGAGS